MTLRQLLMFQAICASGSFSRAAEQLGVAQPALSRQMINLEAELGRSLLDRTVRPIAPTAAGRLLLERAEQILDMTERLKADVSDVGQDVAPVVEIGFVGSALFGRLPAILRQLRQIAPQAKVSLTEMTSLEQVKALKEGRIHAGFGRLAVDDPMIDQRIIARDRLVAALPIGHSLAHSSDAISASALVEERLILYPRQPRPSYLDQVLGLLRRIGLQPLHTQEVADLQTALGLVASDAGIALVPESVIGLRADEIHYRLLDDPQLVTPVTLNCRRQDRSPQLAWLMQSVSREIDAFSE
jgi:LysR family transcriptional regulator, benzoate and cis,cis-muconate-responsive activator of ben and cat genes